MSNSNIPNDLVELQKNTELYSKLVKYVPSMQPNINITKMPEVIIRNPNEEVENLLTQQNEKLDQQTKELQFIRYENMKLNAQIDVLNKTVDSQNSDLERLRNINFELKNANNTLKENNKHYWRNTILIGIFTTVFGILLGKYI